ncbi:hypothetical protein RCM62_16440, partial [Escherichia marmotae]|uniref:hypothetical protein n=1 Tax=Escherichia sp. KTE11 TaxID=1169331 RepID=UPI0012B9C2A9
WTETIWRQSLRGAGFRNLALVLDHAKRETGSLRDLANGRSREFRDIARNVERHNTRGGCV